MQATGPGKFPTTRWTLIFELHDTEEKRTESLDQLCRQYWLPVYGHIRYRSRSPEDAQDLAQAFFQHFLSKKGFERVENDKGKLRSYLKRAVDWFLKGERRKAESSKRGGDLVHLSIDHDLAEERLASLSSRELDPEKAYDQRWARAVLDGVDKSLRAEFEARDRLELHDKLRKYLFWNSGEPSYADLAIELEMSEANIRQSVRRMRKRYGEILREHVGFTVGNEADVDGEIRNLFAAFQLH